MNRKEAEWLGRSIALVPDEAIFPMLNVGSSTLHFRQITQPYIDKFIFEPLRQRNGLVLHLDMKEAPGVDVVGDLLNPKLLDGLAPLKVQSILISNLLEHVTDRQNICDMAIRILPPGGYLFVTGPLSYPYHPDPIDTMFRPTLTEVHSLFPNTIVIDSAVIDSGNWREWDPRERGRPLFQVLCRLLTPFYKPVKWWELARQAPYIFRHITAFALVLRKN